MGKKRGLGRGLDALLGASQAAAPEQTEPTGDDAVAAPSAADAPSNSLPVDLIQRGRYQPRRNFDEDKLRELADSITAQGMVQPIVVRPVDGAKYEIIAGERRWRAAQIAGLADVPVVVKEVDDQTAMAMALIENIQRDDLNPLEEATALHRLLNEFELTHQQVAQAVGKSRTTVTNLIRIWQLQISIELAGILFSLFVRFYSLAYRRLHGLFDQLVGRIDRIDLALQDPALVVDRFVSINFHRNRCYFRQPPHDIVVLGAAAAG